MASKRRQPSPTELIAIGALRLGLPVSMVREMTIADFRAAMARFN